MSIKLLQNKIRIPKEFKIFGIKIDVKFDNKYCNNEGVYGMALYTESMIKLTKESGGMKIQDDKIEQTFYHELTHHIFNQTGWSQKFKEINGIDEEMLVDNISSAFHQAIKTMKY